MKTTKHVEELHIGREPAIGANLLSVMDMLAAYRHYNYFLGRKEAVQYLYDYLEANDKETANKLRYVDDIYIPLTLGWIARLLSRNCAIPEESFDYFVRTLDETIRKFTNNVVVQRQERQRTNDLPKFLLYMEQREDGETEETFSEWLTRNEIGPMSLRPIMAKCAEWVDFWNLVLTDSEMRAAHPGMTDAQIKRLISELKAIISHSENLLENRRRVRKPRKKKQKAADEIVKGIRCLTEFKELNLAGLLPSRIPGAEQLVVYNTKMRKVMWFVAAANGKLGVKGSAVIGFDPEKSIEKGIRKPNEIVPVLAKAGKRELKKVISALTTKDMPVHSGRINPHCILLNVF